VGRVGPAAVKESAVEGVGLDGSEDPAPVGPRVGLACRRLGRRRGRGRDAHTRRRRGRSRAPARHARRRPALAPSGRHRPQPRRALPPAHEGPVCRLFESEIVGCYCRGVRRGSCTEREFEFSVRSRHVVRVRAPSLVRAARLSCSARPRDVRVSRGIPRGYAGHHDLPESRPAPAASSAPCAHVCATASASASAATASGRGCHAAARDHASPARRPPAPPSAEEEVEAEEATRDPAHPAQQAPHARAGSPFADRPHG
jgi:hypothetical protein